MSKWKTKINAGKRIKSSSGRYSAVDETAKKNLSALLNKITILDKQPATSSQAAAFVDQARQESASRIDASYNNRTLRGTKSKQLSARSTYAILKDIAVKRRVKDQTEARTRAMSDVFNSLTCVAVRKTLQQLHPETPNEMVNPMCEYNFDMTSFGIDLVVNGSMDRWVPKEASAAKKNASTGNSP